MLRYCRPTKKISLFVSNEIRIGSNSFLKQSQSTFGYHSNTTSFIKYNHLKQSNWYQNRSLIRTLTSNSSKSSKDKENEVINFDTPIGKRLEAAMKWRLSDLMGVWGAGLLFFGIIISPYISENIKNSTQDYERNVIDDDDITALTQQVLDYVKETKKSPDEDSSNVIIDASSDILTRVLKTEMVQNALIQLSIKVIQSPIVYQATQILIRNLFNDLINDPETFEQLIKLVNQIIQNETTKKAFVDLILQLTKDEEINQAITEMVVRLTKDDEVMEATHLLLKESTHKTLNDQDILDHSMEFAADVVGDDVVQRTSGEALWNTISYSFKPGFSYVVASFGISLVCLSLYLLGPGRPPPLTGEEAAMMKSLSLIGRDIDGNSLHGLSSLWTLPTKIITKIYQWIMNILCFPFKFIGHWTSSCWITLSNIQVKTKCQNFITFLGIQQLFISIWESIPNIYYPIILLDKQWIIFKSFVFELYSKNMSIAWDKWTHISEIMTSNIISKSFQSIWYWCYTKYKRGGNATG